MLNLIKYFLAMLWRCAWLGGQFWLKRESQVQNDALLPLWVVGSLRMGGAGKTPVVNLWANYLTGQGLRVAVMVYAVHARVPGSGTLVRKGDDWRQSSDEAVWHAQNGKYELWATRNRRKTWEKLSKRGGLDLLISDDGLSDPRLIGAQKFLLDWGEPGGSLKELFPLGKLKFLRSDLKVDYTIALYGENPALKYEALMPFGLKSGESVVLCSGVGDFQRLMQDIQALGLRVDKKIKLRNHATNVANVVKKELDKGLKVVVTEKDAVKFSDEIKNHKLLYIANLELKFDLKQLYKYFAKD